MNISELHEGQQVMLYGKVERVGTPLVLVTFTERYKLWMRLDVLHPSDEPRPLEAGDVVIWCSGEKEFRIATLFHFEGVEWSVLTRIGKVSLAMVNDLTLIRTGEVKE